MKLTTQQHRDAERIAEELFVIHSNLTNSGSAGIDPYARSTWKLARAIQLFGATAEVLPVDNSRTAMESLLATL